MLIIVRIQQKLIVFTTKKTKNLKIFYLIKDVQFVFVMRLGITLYKFFVLKYLVIF
jgi:hypothetical protein